MAFWPRDETTENKNPSKQSQSVGEKRRDYPYLEPGLIGAATLSPKRFGWTFFSNPLLPENVIERRLRCRELLEIFPPTRAVPQKLEKASIKQRAEQGANFLRVYLPDVEVASELIRQQLFEDITLSRKVESFNPYSGNLLEAFRDASKLCILFPTGKTNCDLNSCLIDISDHIVTFSPQADSLRSFPTPIQHLALSRRSDANNLAVRTFGSLHLFTLRYADDGESLIMDAHSSLSRSDFADEMVVDMKYSSASPKFLTIGHKGSLFESDFSSGTHLFNQLHQVDSPRSREIGSEFWRLSLDKNVHNNFMLSTKEARQFDIRTSSTNNILGLTAGKHVFTAIEDVHQENLLQLCSTHDILWVDLRYPGKPLLAYAHEREYDQYLSTATVKYPGQGSLTFLSCRSNGLMTVYDVSHSNDGLIRLGQSPYGLSSPTNLYDKHIGQQFLEGGLGLGLLRLSERGGVSYQEIAPNTDQIEREFVIRKSKQIRNMEAAAPNLREGESTFGSGHYSQVNMHEKYNVLFNQDFLKKPEEHSAESLDRMLELFPYCMQNHELPIEHILTAYDVAFRAGDEPRYLGRADFLTKSDLCSTTVYEALKDGRFAPEQVKAPWHRSITSTLERLDEDFRSDPQELMEHLQEFNLSGIDVPECVRDLERAACQQLVSDLVLSSDIFSETIFSKARGDGSLETMTGALSLGSEPPPIKFGYLQPLAPRPTSHEIDDTPMQQLEIPPGVRLLLQDWDNGDPDRYVRCDPFSGIGSSTSKVTGVHDLHNVVQNQRPPPILSVALKGQSQEPTPSPRSEGSQVPPSQDFATNTQVLPGPSGRPTVKKKPTKKRLGGF